MGKPFSFASIAMILAVLACAKATPEQIRKFTPTPPAPTQAATLPVSPTVRTSDTGTPKPLPVSASPMPAVVTGKLNVRDGAGDEFSILAVLQKGDTVTIYEFDTAKDGGQWARIGDGQWVNAKYLESQ